MGFATTSCGISSISQTTGCSPFEAIYGENLIGLLDLVLIPTKDKFSSDAKENIDQIKSSRSCMRGCEHTSYNKMQSILSKLISITSLLSSRREILSRFISTKKNF